MTDSLEYGIFREQGTQGCYRYQHINLWFYPFAPQKGENMKNIDTDFLVEQYKQGVFDDHPFYKYNPRFRKYIFYRYREKYIANKTKKNEAKPKTKKQKYYSTLRP